MSLNSVVNKLVRAAASVPTDISDTDLDAHVARLLADEAKANDSKWSELGLGAFVGSSSSSSRDSPDPSLPKPNKRFLSSVIRAVDGHNSALLRQQAESARSARDSQIKRNARQDDGKRGANRLFGTALGSVGRESRQTGTKDRERREGRDSRTAEDRHRERTTTDRPDRRERDHERRERDREDRHRENDGRSDRRRRRSHSDDDVQLRHERSKYRSRRDRSRSRSRSRSRERDRRDGGDRHKTRRRRSESPRRSPSPKRSSRDTRKPQPRPPSESPPPAPPSPGREPLSRMDRYFKNDYDPRLDFTGVEVPSSGPVTDFGWDSMLSVLKERGKKRRRNSPGLSASPEPMRTALEKRSVPRVAPLPAAGEPGKGIMDYEYSKRGEMRAWDVGKE